jgi:deoxyribonuclease V
MNLSGIYKNPPPIPNMILASDTHYKNGFAKTVCICFEKWTDAQPLQVFTNTIPEPAPYEPGAFYKRELPCILQLLESIPLNGIHAVVVDGYAVLHDEGSPGLGGHLYEHLQHRKPVIGVAKTNFQGLQQLKRPVLRGGSKNPLYITALGMQLDEAAAHIQSMHGPYRMPELLKLLDGMTKE